MKNNKKKKIIFLFKLKKRLYKTLRILMLLILITLGFLFLFDKNMINFVNNIFKKIYVKHVNIINGNICNRISINGIKYANYNNIKNHINDYCLNSDYLIENLKINISKDPWIKNLYIKKRLPNTLKINIIEYNPFAIYTKNGISFDLIDEYGNKIKIPQNEIQNFNYLLVMVGNNIETETNNLFNLMSVYYNITKLIIRVERIGNRRWNLILKNNIVVKMPEETDDLAECWNRLDKLLKVNGLKIGLEEIDLRIKDKVFLKYNNSTIKEINTLKI